MDSLGRLREDSAAAYHYSRCKLRLQCSGAKSFYRHRSGEPAEKVERIGWLLGHPLLES